MAGLHFMKIMGCQLLKMNLRRLANQLEKKIYASQCCQSGATTGNKFRPLVLTEVHKESRNLLKVNETLCTNNLTTSSLISHWVPTLMMGSFSRSSRRSVSAILPLWNFSWNVPCEFIYHAANAPNATADSSSATTSTTIADNRPNDVVVSFFSFQWNIFSKFIDDRLISIRTLASQGS